MNDELNAAERLRYHRHILLPQVGEAGQRKLRLSSVLLIGVGGLGCPAAQYLAAAGVGRLGLLDDDTVEASNLQRQVLYTTADVGRAKVEAAAERLRAMNPHVQVEALRERLTEANAARLFAAYDAVLDGSDNFSTRYLANDAAHFAGKPLVHGSIFRFEGQVTVFRPGGAGPCYRCLHPTPPPPEALPNCVEAGVLGVLPGLVGVLQAVETIKLLLDLGEALCGRLLLIDALALRFRELRLPRDPACPLCGDRPSILSLRAITVPCPTQEASMKEMTVEELKAALDRKEPLVLIDVREPKEHALGTLPGARLLPLGELPARWNEVPKDADVVVYCRGGGRSARAIEFLQQAGYTRIRNLTGGILAWADRIDRSLPKY